MREMLVFFCALLLFTAPAVAAAESGEAQMAEPAPAEASEAAQPNVETDKFGDWGFLCLEAESAEEKDECLIFQNAILRGKAEEGEETKPRRLMHTEVRFVEDQEGPVLFVTVPLGILLPAGLRLDAEGYDQLSIPVQRCDAGGCLGLLPMQNQLVEAFKQGEEAHITFFNIARKPNKVRISLMGFTKALSELKKRQ